MTNPKPQPPIIPTNSKVVYENPWIKIREDTTTTPDGRKGLYGYMESRDSCMVVAVDDQDRIYLVRGFRYPSRSYGWELPGGGGDNQDLLTASKRELEEETGILADSWQKLGEAYVCNGLMTEKLAFYHASQLHFDGQRQDSEEKFDDMGLFSKRQINHMIRTGDINDCQTLAGLQYYETWKQNKEE